MSQRKRTAQLSAQESELFKRMLSVLLSGKGSCLHTVSENGFTSSLINGPQHFAIERLLAEFAPSEEFADIVANAYLDRFIRRSHPLTCDTDALEYAQRIADTFPISKATAERLVRCIAAAGWYGRLENCARRYCNRAPTPTEIALLFENYMTSASHGTSTDEALAMYAMKYLSTQQAHRQLRLLAERNKRFLSDVY